MVAVLYPETSQNYATVFRQILEGIDEKVPVSTSSFAVTTGTDSSETANQIRRIGAKVVIALGQRALQVARTVDKSIPVVVGAILSITEEEADSLYGVSMLPDPALLFSHMKGLAPAIRSIHVVYDPQNNDWMIRLAKEAGRSLGLDVHAHVAGDIQSAARRYEAIMATIDPKSEAVWLLPDPSTLDESTIVPFVLKSSWDRNIKLFSSLVLHARKGALFAVSPNNREMGAQLGSIAVALASSQHTRRGMTTVKEVNFALNARTAAHLGLRISATQQSKYPIIFPER